MCQTRINIGKMAKRAKINLGDLKKKAAATKPREPETKKENKDKKGKLVCTKCNVGCEPCHNVMTCFNFSMQ